jgi:hypothetical protein
LAFALRHNSLCASNAWLPAPNDSARRIYTAVQSVFCTKYKGDADARMMKWRVLRGDSSSASAHNEFPLGQRRLPGIYTCNLLCTTALRRSSFPRSAKRTSGSGTTADRQSPPALCIYMYSARMSQKCESDNSPFPLAH